MLPCGVKGCSAHVQQTKIVGWGGTQALAGTSCKLCGHPVCKFHKTSCGMCADCATKVKMGACIGGLATLSLGYTYFT